MRSGLDPQCWENSAPHWPTRPTSIRTHYCSGRFRTLAERWISSKSSSSFSHTFSHGNWSPYSTDWILSNGSNLPSDPRCIYLLSGRNHERGAWSLQWRELLKLSNPPASPPKLRRRGYGGLSASVQVGNSASEISAGFRRLQPHSWCTWERPHRATEGIASPARWSKAPIIE